ncbi:MAG: hypothetical protein VKK05_05235 [Synechococcus sp.]|nr:hypothetical protein [Synechococcus sp.]
MALRRHRLPRFWLALTLGLVAGGVATAYWWEQQLPSRLEQAAKQGDLEACLRYSEQLESLRWLGGQAPLEQGSCRRRRAAQLWQQKRWAAALQQQLQLVNSQAGKPSDQQQLLLWQQNLQEQALGRFQDGDLNGSLALLAAMGEDRRSDGASLGDKLREIWTRNRLQLERAKGLSAQRRWWEALDALNRIDHPWWKNQSQPLQATVQQGIENLAGKQREHDAHGQLPHTVPSDQLDALVRQRLAKGMDEWSAFQEACRALGGRIVEAGPETACQR